MHWPGSSSAARIVAAQRRRQHMCLPAPPNPSCIGSRLFELFGDHPELLTTISIHPPRFLADDLPWLMRSGGHLLPVVTSVWFPRSIAMPARGKAHVRSRSGRLPESQPSPRRRFRSSRDRRKGQAGTFGRSRALVAPASVVLEAHMQRSSDRLRRPTRKEELNELLDDPGPGPDRRHSDATAGGAMVDGLSTGRGRAPRHLPAAGCGRARGPIARLDRG